MQVQPTQHATGTLNPTDGAPPVVEMRGITKRFGTLVACDAVDLKVAPGALHALMGENGAGKTTLMRILYGYYAPDAGELYLKGKRVHFRSPADAIIHHIGMVSQHYSIIPELSALDNLILGAEPVGALGWLKRREALQKADQLAQMLEFSPDWNRPAAELSVAARQKLEILKLLWRDAEILILDEPTAMLSPRDVDALFETLLRLKAQGRTILLVTHKLNEALRYADYVTVLRSGRKVADAPISEVDAPTLTRWIIGDDTRGLDSPAQATTHKSVGVSMTQALSTDKTAHATRAVLTLHEVYVPSDRGGWGVQGLNLEVYAGEIVGVAGVDGSGQLELMEALAGLRPVAKGEIQLNGQPMQRWSTAQRIRAGIRYLFDDRFRRMMAPQWSVLDNAILGAQRDPELQTWGWFKPRALRRRAEALVERFQVKVPSLRAPILQLSGGNQQRLVIARALYGQPRLLIAYAPTRGLDIRGAEATYAAIRRACNHGMAALVIAFDLDELMEHCDRIAVLFKGAIVQQFPREAFSREAIGAAMVGASAG
ncbi:MAG: heme ABC transporter ATP-binding protein [Armatimonadetes bacterium CP1_7O]|nr:MAG: heme ABC transporter ATP-binding protein [Armatimonadetes bacterium CP1_7O]